MMRWVAFVCVLLGAPATLIASCGGASAHIGSPMVDESQSPVRATALGRDVADEFEGRASYYSDSLAGRSTASGEPYAPRAFTAAHRELRFGTLVRVIRLDTGATTYVRINDRGPFGGRGRVIDLSRAAAEELDMLRAGVVEVRVEVFSSE